MYRPVAMAVIGLFAVGFAPIAVAHDSRWLGDGRISSEPRIDYLFSCQQNFNPNAPGAHRIGAWVQGDRYHSHEKPHVGGNVDWPNARIDVVTENGERIVRANNLPTHATGEFPIRRSDPAYQYDRNPNSIRQQNILLRLPLTPTIAATASCVPMGLAGFTLVGGALYNALDARGIDAAAYEILDACGGHPQQQGQYHYHDYAPCLTDGTDRNGHSVLVAYALDGFGVYGAKDVGGGAVTNKDLDACHGHEGSVMWNGAIQSIYHYHLNDEYPYSIGCFRGMPVQSPSNGGPGLSGPAGGSDPISAIARELNLDANELRRAVGPPPPDIDRAARILEIDPQLLRAAFERHRPR